MLESTGLPVAYRAWPENEAPPLPFICYLVSYSNNFSADGIVYYPINHIQIELYTKLKDTVIENRVETTLSSFSFKKIEKYIDTEQCYQIIYEFEV
nr:MAG TPA: tail completion protein [Caudoviricetes sp.]